MDRKPIHVKINEDMFGDKKSESMASKIIDKGYLEDGKSLKI